MVRSCSVLRSSIVALGGDVSVISRSWVSPVTLLAAFWTIPFVARIDVTNSMDYQRNEHIARSLWPVLAPTRPEGAEVFSIAVVLAVSGSRGPCSGGTASPSASRASASPRRWRSRSFPKGTSGTTGCCPVVSRGVRARRFRRARHRGGHQCARRRRAHAPPRRHPSGLGPTLAVGALTFMSIALPAGLVPRHTPVPSLDGWTPGLQWAGSTAGYGKPKAEGWAGYNYSGFEAKKGWPEYKGLLDELKKLPCGRLAWEQDKEIKKAGKTTKADLYDSFGSSLRVHVDPVLD